jgi:hypothetical protein
MRLPEQIPKRLRQDACFLPGLVDGEGAWPKDSALAVLESLKATTVAVSDVTPLSPMGEAWIASEIVWSLHRLHNESDIDYARRSRLEAAEFIEDFEGAEGDVLFALTFPMFKDAA